MDYKSWNISRKISLWLVSTFSLSYLATFILVVNLRPTYADEVQDQSVSTARRLSSSPGCYPMIGADGIVVEFCPPTSSPTPTPIINPPTSTPSASPRVVVTPTPSATPKSTATTSPTATPKPTSTPKTTPKPATVSPASESSTTQIVETPAAGTNNIVIETSDLPAQDTSTDNNKIIPADLVGGKSPNEDFALFSTDLAGAYRDLYQQDLGGGDFLTVNSKTGEFNNQAEVDKNPLLLSALYGETLNQITSVEDYYKACLANDLTKDACSGYKYSITDENGCSSEIKAGDEDLVDLAAWLENHLQDLGEKYNAATGDNKEWHLSSQSLKTASGDALNLDHIPSYNPAKFYQIDNPQYLSNGQIKDGLSSIDEQLKEIDDYFKLGLDSVSSNNSSKALASVDSAGANVPQVISIDYKSKVSKIALKYPTVGSVVKAESQLKKQKAVLDIEKNYRDTPAGKLWQITTAPVGAIEGAAGMAKTIDQQIRGAISDNTRIGSLKDGSKKKSGICKQKNPFLLVNTPKEEVFIEKYGDNLKVLRNTPEVKRDYLAEACLQNKDSSALLSRGNNTQRSSRLVNIKKPYVVEPSVITNKDVPHLNQLEYEAIAYPYGGNKATISSSGCGVVSAAVSLIYLDNKFNDGILPELNASGWSEASFKSLTEKLADQSLAGGGRYCGGTNKNFYSDILPKNYDVNYQNISGMSKEVVKGYLANGIPVILSGIGKAPFTEDGHLVVAIGGGVETGSDGKERDLIYVLDPNGGKYMSYAYEDVMGQVTPGKMYAIYPKDLSISVQGKLKK